RTTGPTWPTFLWDPLFTGTTATSLTGPDAGGYFPASALVRRKGALHLRIWILMMLGTSLAFGQAMPADTMQRCQSILIDAAHDRNPDGRKGAAEALSLVGVKDDALESLAPMLDDHDVPVRIAVVVTLGDFNDNRTLPLLKKALQDPIPEVDFAAAKVLYQLHDPEGVQFLLAVVGRESK